MKKPPYGVCGVYCGQCASGNGRLKFFALELRRLTDVYVRWMEHEDVGFNHSEFRKGLEVISGYQCPGCLGGGGMPCQNRECAKGKGLRGCLECVEFPTCEKTEYQRERYPFVLESYEKVQREGFEAWIEEQDRKAKAGFDMCAHLLVG